jgi:hypothetical protein
MGCTTNPTTQRDETRRIYIEALKAADNYDFNALLAFARS